MMKNRTYRVVAIQKRHLDLHQLLRTVSIISRSTRLVINLASKYFQLFKSNSVREGLSAPI